MSRKTKEKNQWKDMVVRENTQRTLRIMKAQMDFPTYDDAIQYMINKLQIKF